MTVVDGSAWDGLCDTLKKAGRAILRPECPATDADRAEGYHYLLGLVHSMMTNALYDPGPEHPAFVRGMDDVVKFGLDAPDGCNSYSASIRADLDYRIRGIARPATYVGWQVMGPRGTLHNCELGEFEVAADGTFEIILSQRRHDGNWIPLPEGANLIMERQFHADWAKEDYIETHIATLEPRPGLGNGLDNPTPERMDAMFDTLARKIAFHADFWVDFVHGFRANGDNVAPPAIFNPAIGGSTTQLASNGYFDVPEGQALLIEFRPPKARYWSVVLGNFWFMSIELHHHQSSLNGHQAHVDDDGICRIVLSHGDPGVANWLDPFEHTNGTITFRWLLADAAPDVSMRLVPAGEIDAHLPADTRRLTPAEREAVLAGRRAEAIKRWSMPMVGRWFEPLALAGSRRLSVLDMADDVPGWFADALAAPCDSRFVDVEGCAIHYLRWGDPDKPGLMFVPGAGQHARWFAHVAPLFADQFHVVAIDPGGCGDSGRRDGYSLDLVVREIAAVCADSGMFAASVAPTIVGHSMGGQFAVRAALAHGERFLGVIAVDALRYAALDKDPAARAFAARAAPPLPAQPVYPDVETLIARFRLQPAPLIDIGARYILDHIARHSVRPVAGGWTWKHDVATMGILTLGLELKDALHTLRCHAAAIYGEHTHLADHALIEEMTRATHGKVPIFVVPGTSHYPMLDSPLAFVAAVKGVALAWRAAAAAGVEPGEPPKN